MTFEPSRAVSPPELTLDLHPSRTAQERPRVVPLLHGGDAGAQHLQPKVQHLLTGGARQCQGATVQIAKEVVGWSIRTESPETNPNGSGIFPLTLGILCACEHIQRADAWRLKYSLEADADQRSELDVHLSVRQVVCHVYRLHCLERTNRGCSTAFFFFLNSTLLHKTASNQQTFSQFSATTQWTTFVWPSVRFTHPVQQLLWREHLPIFIQPGKYMGMIHFSVVHVLKYSAVLLPKTRRRHVSHISCLNRGRRLLPTECVFIYLLFFFYTQRNASYRVVIKLPRNTARQMVCSDLNPEI